MLSAGKMIVLQPALLAATVFSRRPPILSTLPVSVSSPVMATVGLTGTSRASDNRDVAIVMPADGPSFDTAPSGTCRCILALLKKWLSGNCLTMKDLAKE